MEQFKPGDIIWVNLGFSYGWWPGEYQIWKTEKKPVRPTLQISSKSENSPKANSDIPIAQVRFFDDEKFDLLNIYDVSNIKPYSCEEKETLIQEGLDKFSCENNATAKGGSMFGFGARQAQFYKDVEMAEVMTDNSPTVAEILAKYEVIEDAEPAPPPPKKKKRRRKAY